MRKLLFSNASPFARRVRIVLEEKQLNYDKDILDALRPVEDIRSVNPALQVPVLHDSNRTLWGSDLILEYLLETYSDSPGTDPNRPLARSITRSDQRWDDGLILTTIGALADSLVNVRLVRAGAGAASLPYMDRQMTRINACLDWLEERATPEGFWPGTFSIMDVSLMCPLLYGEERDIFQYRTGHWPTISALIDALSERASVKATPVTPR
ncbi:MAG: glutathione S-transferase family protein [Hyphomicrobiaceae bacterium]